MFYKKGVSKNLQNSQEKAFTRASFLIKLQAFNVSVYITLYFTLYGKKQIFTNSLKRHAIIFNLLSANPKLVNSQLIVWVCLAILRGWRLKG